MEEEKKISDDEKREINKAMGAILYESICDLDELHDMKKKGIDGIKSMIKNPEYDPDLPVNGFEADERGYPVDEFVPAPIFYQLESVQKLWKQKRLLIADEMGLGKTLQAVASKAYIENQTKKKLKTLVVVPNIRQQWEERIREYVEEDKVGNVVRLHDYSDASIEKLKDADWAIINYEALSFNDKKTDGNGRSAQQQKIKDAIMKAGFDYVILDEAHNAKNPGTLAYRSRHVKDVADQAEYVALLSGTPVPNTLKDTYMLISLLEPRRFVPDEDEPEKGKWIGYATADNVRKAYRGNPDLIRAVLSGKRMRRENREIRKWLPKINERKVVVEMGELQNALYQNILENYELEGMYKLQQLRKAVIEPELVDPEVIGDYSLRKARLEGKIESAKHRRLDKLVEELTGRGEKVVIFSPEFRAGITEELEARYRERYGALRMDGNNGYRREEIKKEFQRNKKKRVLIATNVAGEGISLTAANNLVFLHEPYAPGQRDQMVSRIYRWGQKRKEVNIYSMCISETVSKEGKRSKTIDEGVLEFLRDKRKAIEYVSEKGMPLTPEQRKLMKEKMSETYAPLQKYIYTPDQLKVRDMHRKNSEMAGLGTKKILKWSKTGGKRYAEGYCIRWDDSYSANVARIYKQIIEGLETEIELTEKLDLASAFGTLSSILGEKTTNVDIIPDHYQTECANQENQNICASITNLPLPSERFDLAVCSLALHDLLNRDPRAKRKQEPTGKPFERSGAVIEANRVLKPGGYYITTIPMSYMPEGGWKDLSQYGLEVVPELTGPVKSLEPSRIDTQAYLMVAKKTSKPKQWIDNTKVHLKVDNPYDPEKKGQKKPKFYQGKRGVAKSFVYFDPKTGQEEALEIRVLKYLERTG